MILVPNDPESAVRIVSSLNNSPCRREKSVSVENKSTIQQCMYDPAGRVVLPIVSLNDAFQRHHPTARSDLRTPRGQSGDRRPPPTSRILPTSSLFPTKPPPDHAFFKFLVHPPLQCARSNALGRDDVHDAAPSGKWLKKIVLSLTGADRDKLHDEELFSRNNLTALSHVCCPRGPYNKPTFILIFSPKTA